MKKTGGVAPSSYFLAKRISLLVPKEAELVIELGGGTGALTSAILKRIGPSARLTVFESNPVFIEKLKKIQDGRLTIVEGNAENVEEYIPTEKYGQIDAIISSIPIANLKKEDVLRILQKWHTLLADNGICIQYQYSLLTQKIFKQVFKNTRVSFEARNIPPAFIYRGKKEASQ